jgi:hypothetical protein
MNKVYIVTFNGQVSSEGYDDVDKAIDFVESRSNDPIKDFGLIWIDSQNNVYRIYEINVK